ncbi:hypothetical protein AAHE18_16G048500 [Arachis hypogaea]
MMEDLALKFDKSKAISTPELPEPTTRTCSSLKSFPFLYPVECINFPFKPSTRGTRGSAVFPVATTKNLPEYSSTSPELLFLAFTFHSRSTSSNSASSTDLWYKGLMLKDEWN